MKRTSRGCGYGGAISWGQVILTGAEGREIERQRADRLAEQLWAMGTNPDEV